MSSSGPKGFKIDRQTPFLFRNIILGVPNDKVTYHPQSTKIIWIFAIIRRYLQAWKGGKSEDRRRRRRQINITIQIAIINILSLSCKKSHLPYIKMESTSKESWSPKSAKLMIKSYMFSDTVLTIFWLIFYAEENCFLLSRASCGRSSILQNQLFPLVENYYFPGLEEFEIDKTSSKNWFKINV